MNTDPRPFIAAALSGLASRPIHDQITGIDPKTKKPIVAPGAKAEHVGARAVELGVAAAAAFESWQAEQDAAEKPPKKR